jgi:hypothetical protein
VVRRTHISSQLKVRSAQVGTEQCFRFIPTRTSHESSALTFRMVNSETISTASILSLFIRVKVGRMLHGRRLRLPLSQPKLHQLDF